MKQAAILLGSVRNEGVVDIRDLDRVYKNV